MTRSRLRKLVRLVTVGRIVVDAHGVPVLQGAKVARRLLSLERLPPRQRAFVEARIARSAA